MFLIKLQVDALNCEELRVSLLLEAVVILARPVLVISFLLSPSKLMLMSYPRYPSARARRSLFLLVILLTSPLCSQEPHKKRKNHLTG